jgi:hypothetical protein
MSEKHDDWTRPMEEQLFDDRNILFNDCPVAELLYALAINVGMYEQAKRGNMTPEQLNPYLIAMHERLGRHAKKAHNMLMDIRFSDIPELKGLSEESREMFRLGEHIATDAFHGKPVDPDDVRIAKAVASLLEQRTENVMLCATIKTLVEIIQSFGR